jgi:quercetin dioxygenase-like cupin family protein
VEALIFADHDRYEVSPFFVRHMSISVGGAEGGGAMNMVSLAVVLQEISVCKLLQPVCEGRIFGQCGIDQHYGFSRVAGKVLVRVPRTLDEICCHIVLKSCRVMATYRFRQIMTPRSKSPRSRGRRMTMHAPLCHTEQALLRYPLFSIVLTVALALILTPGAATWAQEARGSNTQPLAFGPDQTIIDLNKLVWTPLEAEGVPPGPELAILRGDPKFGGLEVVLRLPARYTFANHSHTSDEVYVWLKGSFTYIAADGTTTPLSGQTYISLPGNVPHALACGDEPCVFYVRYSRPLDLHLHAMPALKK